MLKNGNSIYLIVPLIRNGLSDSDVDGYIYTYALRILRYLSSELNATKGNTVARHAMKDDYIFQISILAIYYAPCMSAAAPETTTELINRREHAKINITSVIYDQIKYGTNCPRHRKEMKTRT